MPVLTCYKSVKSLTDAFIRKTNISCFQFYLKNCTYLRLDYLPATEWNMRFRAISRVPVELLSDISATPFDVINP
jgi:hypothetical protein